MSSPTPPPAKSGKPWLWIVLGILGVLLLICGGVCAGVAYVGQQAVQKAQEAAKSVEVLPIVNLAVTSIASDPLVQEKVGDNIALSGIPSREGEGPLDYANTVVLFDVLGPKGTATVTAHAKQVDGAWEITNIKVQFNDGSTTEVKPPEAGAPQLNF